MTAAYDLLTDKDKRARYDRGEIDEQGNPKAPFGFGGGGGGGFRPGGGGGLGSSSAAARRGDFGDIFEGLFGGGGRGGGGFNAGFGGGARGRRRRAPTSPTACPCRSRRRRR